MRCPPKRPRNASIGRVEWPIVKIVIGPRIPYALTAYTVANSPSIERSMTDKHAAMAGAAPRLTDIRKQRTPIRRVNIEHRESLSGLERAALWITNRVGTMGFFLLIFGWTVLWLSW